MTEALPAGIAEAIAADPHPPGGVDRALLGAQVWLTHATQTELYRAPPPLAAPDAGRRPWLEETVGRLLDGATHDFQRATALRRWVAAIPRAFPEDGPSTAEGRWGDFTDLPCGGIEEELIRRGTPLAAELSRVLVTLARLAGMNARIIFLYADAQPVRHAVTEIHVAGRWSVFDPVSDRTFIWPKHGYASAWELRTMPKLLDGLQDHARLRYVDSRFYRHAGIAVYDPWGERNDDTSAPIDPATAARLRAGEAS